LQCLAQSIQEETSKRKREEENNETENISSSTLLPDQTKQIETIIDNSSINTNTNEEESLEPVKKKKKQFVAKTNFVNNDEFEDILESGWFYLDSYEKPQGPFSTREMRQWYIAGFFFETTMVKRINEEEFTSISECVEFKNYDLSSSIVSTDIYSMNSPDFSPQKKVDSYGDMDQSGHNYSHYDEPAYYSQPAVSGNYAQTAYFNTHNGRFAPVSNYYAAKGLPEDKAGRMLSHFLDMDSYQESMRAAKNSEPETKPKVTKKMVSAFKKKKVDKQRRRILMM